MLVMKRKMVSAVTLTLLLTSMLTFAFHIEPVKASGTIYIMADGSIDPPTAPIFTMDNITYTITANISESIVVERDNIVVDGAGYTVTGSGVGPGIFLQSISNVTVKNTVIRGIRDYYEGIALAGCYACILSENNLSDNTYSIGLFGSSNITLRNNHMSGQYNFRVDGCELQHFIHDVDDSNMVNGKPVYYFINRQNESFSQDAGYLAFVNSTNIAVENLSLTGNGEGLLIAYSQNLLIKNVTITDNYYGVSLNQASHIILSGNNITANNNHGIHLEYSSNNSIYGNNITNNGYGGIHLLYSSDNSISENNVANNSYDGIYLSSYSNNNSIFGNTIANNADGLVFSESSNYNSISENNITANDICGISLRYLLYNNSIISNLITRNPFGIALYSASCNIITSNNVSNNDYGIILDYYSQNNIINDNTIAASLHGIRVTYSSTYNIIYCNNFTDNYEQLQFYEASNNTVYHNNFVSPENRIPWSTSENIWDDGYPSGGNYWSDYVGVDVKSGPGQDLPGSDGIGDMPYIIDADNVDHYPLMYPYGAPPPQSYSLTITATVGGTTDPAPGTYSYTADSSVKVAAIPNANYLFDHWELDSVNVGSANPYTVLMDRDHTLKAVFSLILPPLSVSISPLSVSILVGQSVTFTSNVSGGYTPYSYQWYPNGVPVSGATSNTWTFTPATAGIYYVYLRVTDAKGNTAQSDTARVTVAAVPVGGYSIPIQAPATATPLTPYLILTAILTIAFTTIKHKITKKTKKPP